MPLASSLRRLHLPPHTRAIPRDRSLSMSQTKRGDISYNWRGSLKRWKQSLGKLLRYRCAMHCNPSVNINIIASRIDYGMMSRLPSANELIEIKRVHTRVGR